MSLKEIKLTTCHQVTQLLDISKVLNLESINLSFRESLGYVPTKFYTGKLVHFILLGSIIKHCIRVQIDLQLLVFVLVFIYL